MEIFKKDADGRTHYEDQYSLGRKGSKRWWSEESKLYRQEQNKSILVSFLITDNMPNRSNVRLWFITLDTAHCGELGMVTWMSQPLTAGDCGPAYSHLDGSENRQDETITFRICLHWPTPLTSWPPQPTKTTASTGDQVFKHVISWGQWGSCCDKPGHVDYRPLELVCRN